MKTIARIGEFAIAGVAGGVGGDKFKATGLTVYSFFVHTDSDYTEGYWSKEFGESLVSYLVENQIQTTLKSKLSSKVEARFIEILKEVGENANTLDTAKIVDNILKNMWDQHKKDTVAPFAKLYLESHDKLAEMGKEYATKYFKVKTPQLASLNDSWRNDRKAAITSIINVFVGKIAGLIKLDVSDVSKQIEEDLSKALKDIWVVREDKDDTIKDAFVEAFNSSKRADAGAVGNKFDAFEPANMQAETVKVTKKLDAQVKTLTDNPNRNTAQNTQFKLLTTENYHGLIKDFMKLGHAEDA